MHLNSRVLTTVTLVSVLFLVAYSLPSFSIETGMPPCVYLCDCNQDGNAECYCSSRGGAIGCADSCETLDTICPEDKDDYPNLPEQCNIFAQCKFRSYSEPSELDEAPDNSDLVEDFPSLSLPNEEESNVEKSEKSDEKAIYKFKGNTLAISSMLKAGIFQGSPEVSLIVKNLGPIRLAR